MNEISDHTGTNQSLFMDVETNIIMKHVSGDWEWYSTVLLFQLCFEAEMKSN